MAEKKVPGLTIDGPTTLDIDDAVWVEARQDGWDVTVSIADVAGAVADGTHEDLQARAMVETKYFASGNSPMLPRVLSEDRLSLWPGKTRRVLSLRLALDAALDVTSVTWVAGTLCSRAKLTYAAIPGMLADTSNAHWEVLAAAVKLSHALLAKRRAAGALVLYDLNSGWVTTEEGFLRRIEDHRETIGQVIIQELMVLANAAVARWAIENDVPILFRNHTARLAAPDRDELVRQIDEATRLPMTGLDLLRQRTHMLLDRAVYGADVRGHYGLNLPAYTHFTSPIRRYADLVTHRQVRAHLLGKPLPYTRERIAEFAAHIAKVQADERESLSRAMKEKAERKAVYAVESRRLDGLCAKDFERVTKVEARSGAPASEAFVEAFVRRAADDRLPLLCATVVLTAAPDLPEWVPVKEAVVRALARRPEDAASVLAQVPQVADGWSEPVFRFAEEGPPHSRSFTVGVELKGGERAYAGVGQSRQKKRAEQWAAVSVLAAVAKVEAPKLQEPQTKSGPAAVAKPVVDPGKDPISSLNEWTQKSGVGAPGYEFEVTGPSHIPVVTCRGKAGGHDVVTQAANKQDAKRLAARELLTLLAQHGLKEAAPA